MFAGEDVQCTITFKNVASPEGCDPSPARKQNGFALGGGRQRKLPPVHSSTRPSISRNSSFVSQIPGSPHLRGHRPAQSLHASSVAGDARSPISPGGAFGNNGRGHKHGRSISIISLGTDAAVGGSHNGSVTPTRPHRGHGRSASMQVMPNRPSSYPGTSSAEHALQVLTVLQQLRLASDQPPIPLHSQAAPRFLLLYKSLQTSSRFQHVHRDEGQGPLQRRVRRSSPRQDESHQGLSRLTSSFQWPLLQRSRRQNGLKYKTSHIRPLCKHPRDPHRPLRCREREVNRHSQRMAADECLRTPTLRHFRPLPGSYLRLAWKEHHEAAANSTP